MVVAPGSRVRLRHGEEELEGVLITDSPLVLKLDNGYNIGLDRRKVGRLEVLAPPAATPVPARVLPAAAGLPRIVILHTGGTIASRVDYTTGAVVAAIAPEDLVAQVPELATLAQVSSVLVGNVQSEELRFVHYNKIAHAVAAALGIDKPLPHQVAGALTGGRPQGIIVTTGTDTLHYTAAALAFALENVPVPVVLVGAQRSSDRPSSDAAANLIAAALYITKGGQPGVVACLHRGTDNAVCHVLPGPNCRKLHTSRRDAFRPVNAGSVANVFLDERRVEILSRPAPPAGPFQVRPFKEGLKVGILRAHPQMFAAEVDAYRNFDGLIIEATGLGHFPSTAIDAASKENARVFEAVGKLVKKMPVALAPQTIYGRLNLYVYSPQRRIAALGVLGHNLDMTVECAFIKLAWLLSNAPRDRIKDLYAENLRGEVHERLEPEWFLT